jgi:hypothetical protein
VNTSKITWAPIDNGGKRTDIGRGCFSSSDHISERRHIKDRQAPEDRRSRSEGRLAEPEKAFSDVRTLKGLITICASCKKIRDDKGYWEQIETFIRNHLEVNFSHGFCPECAKKALEDFHSDKDEQPRRV